MKLRYNFSYSSPDDSSKQGMATLEIDGDKATFHIQPGPPMTRDAAKSMMSYFMTMLEKSRDGKVFA